MLLQVVMEIISQSQQTRSPTRYKLERAALKNQQISQMSWHLIQVVETYHITWCRFLFFVQYYLTDVELDSFLLQTNSVTLQALRWN